MLRALFAASLVALLAGCASAPKPQVKQSYTSSAKVVQPSPTAKAAPAVKAEPKKTFKEKWLSRFFRDRAQ